MNRTKVLVLALFASYWVTVVALLVAARDVYDGQLSQAIPLAGDPRRLSLKYYWRSPSSLLCCLLASSATGAGPSG